MAGSTYIYSLLMKGYVKSINFEKAEKLLKKMEGSAIFHPNKITYNTFVQCAMAAGRVQEARQVFMTMPDRDIITFSIYLSGLFD
jgi:pentatricopeptide repeat protein